MGINKWLLKHGAGVGGYAKAMVKSYIIIKKANPQASKGELFNLLIKSRMDAHAACGQRVIDEQTQKEIVKDSGGSLSRLILLLLWQIEPKWRLASYKYQWEAREVVWEIVDKYGLSRELDYKDKNELNGENL